MSSKILVYGSIAFDVLFSVTDDFRKSLPLKEGTLRKVNATYVADAKNEHFGGTAGNMCAWLGKEDVESTLFSAFGTDFRSKGYAQKLESLKVDIRGSEGEFSAHAYVISDPLHQQITIWQPNDGVKIDDISLTDYLTETELQNLEYAIFSAGTPSSIKKHIAEFKGQNPAATIIFDPAQVTPFWEASDFTDCCEMAHILIGNDIEFRYFGKYMDHTFPTHLTLIETLGAEGVKLTHQGKIKKFPAQPVENVIETTGAGDAFRAGFLSVFLKEKNYEAAIKKGTELGAKCVTLPSAQC
jgi:adenosine kinase